MKTTQTAHTFQCAERRQYRLRYLLFLPRGYGARTSERWPLMLFLHGAGERGANLSKVARHGPPRLVRRQPDFPFILVSPQCPTGRHWCSEGLIALLNHVTASYRVDQHRIFVTGLSMGGYATWSLAAAYPDRFAAVVPICGGGSLLPILLAEGRTLRMLRDLSVWAFHGARDPIVPVSESERMIAALREIGGEPKYTVYPEAEHDAWTETYNNPGLYKWLLAHSRRSPKASSRR